MVKPTNRPLSWFETRQDSGGTRMVAMETESPGRR